MYHYNSALCGTAASSDDKHQGSNPTVGAIDADQGAEARKRQRADDDMHKVGILCTLRSLRLE